MSSISVCLNCEERYPACHDHCTKYLDAKREHDERIAAIRESKKSDINFYEYIKYKRRREK